MAHRNGTSPTLFGLHRWISDCDVFRAGSSGSRLVHPHKGRLINRHALMPLKTDKPKPQTRLTQVVIYYQTLKGGDIFYSQHMHAPSHCCRAATLYDMSDPNSTKLLNYQDARVKTPERLAHFKSYADMVDLINRSIFKKIIFFFSWKIRIEAWLKIGSKISIRSSKMSLQNIKGII